MHICFIRSHNFYCKMTMRFVRHTHLKTHAFFTRVRNSWNANLRMTRWNLLCPFLCLEDLRWVNLKNTQPLHDTKITHIPWSTSDFPWKSSGDPENGIQSGDELRSAIRTRFVRVPLTSMKKRLSKHLTNILLNSVELIHRSYLLLFQYWNCVGAIHN